jgi:hypothetical protein
LKQRLWAVRELVVALEGSFQLVLDPGVARPPGLASPVRVLSQSATTRLAARLESRGLLQRYLCPTDQRGIYTELTDAGRALLDRARPTHDATLTEALDEADQLPELSPLVAALTRLSTSAAAARRR